MDCKTARLLVEFFRPVASELTGSEAKALELHLAECAECARFAQAERAWEARVAGAVQEVPIPAQLRERLHAGVDLAHARRRVQRTRRLIGGAAIAAALLLALGLGWHWKRSHPPRLDLEQLAADFFGETANPFAGNVEAYFHQTDRAFVAPRNFNYANLSYYSWSALQGKKVPLLLFTNLQRREQARVYFLSREKFNLNALELDAPNAGSGGCKVAVQLLPEGQGAHLILYTSESLDPFLGSDDPRAAFNALDAAP